MQSVARDSTGRSEGTGKQSAALNSADWRHVPNALCSGMIHVPGVRLSTCQHTCCDGSSHPGVVAYAISGSQ